MSAEKTVNIIFKGDDRVSKAIQGISTSMGKLEGMVESVAQPFARIGEGVLAADAALAALAIGGLTYAYKKSMDFESASAELAKVLDDEIDKLDDAKKYALELSNEYGRSSTSILEATAGFKQAGFNVQEAMDLTKLSLDLAIVGQLDAVQASELLIASLKGFKAPASEAEHLLDVMNVTSNKYATDLEQLALGMAAISPIAEKMGFSFEETAGLITPVIEVFRSGPEAARALRTGLNKLIDDATPVQEALERLGVSQTDVNGQLRSGRDILADLSEAFKTASEADKLFLTQQLVGTEQSVRMVEVFDGLNKRLGITENALKGTGSSAKEVEIQLATSKVAVERFGVAFENAATAMGDRFREAATESVEGGTEILNVLQDLASSGTFDPLFDAVEGYARDLGGLLSQVAAVLPEAMEGVNWDDLVKAIDDLVGGFQDLFDGIDLTTAEGLGKAIQAVVDTLESLIRVTKGMLTYLDPVWDSIREGISRFNSLDDASKESAGEFLGAAVLVAKAGAKIGLALAAIEKSGAKIENVFNVVIGSVKTIWNAFQVTFDLLAKGVVGALELIVSGAEKITRLPGMKAWNESLKNLEKELELTVEAIDEHLFEQVDQTLGGMSQAWDGITGKVRETGKAGEESMKKIAEATNVTVSAVGAGAEEIKQHLTGKMAEAEQGVSSDLAAIAREIETAIPSEKSMALQIFTDPESKEKAKKDAEEISKAIEDSVERDLGIIKAETERYEALLDYRLGVIQEEGKTARAVAKSVADSFSAAESTIGGLFGEFASLGEGENARYTVAKFYEIQNAIRKQQQIAKQLADAQTDNLEAQTRLLEARAERVETGEAAIKVEVEGVYPELDMILWEILKRAQVRATEEGSAFLLGY
ncbi:MAG: phage tail tape measure protein [Desulfobacteraceae bacterium]|jgi:TP901 family phage tail tape measure protein